MIRYRLYFIDASEHSFRSDEFNAFDDEGAEAFALRHASDGPVELWCRNRLVRRWSELRPIVNPERLQARPALHLP